MIPQLRPYQTDSMEATVKAYIQDGQNRILLKKPTGTGKTVTFAAMLKFLQERIPQIFAGKKGAKMLVVAHREELLEQAAKKISAANPGLIVDIEQADRYASRQADVIIASIQTLLASKFRRLKILLNHHSFPFVIIDESHHAAAPSYRTMLVHLGFLPPADASESVELEAVEFDDVAVMKQALEGWDLVAPKDRLLVGVTATPNRTDAIGLGCVFQTIAYSYALKQAIADGWLAPIRPWVVESDVSLDDVKISHGDFNQKQLAAAVNQEQRNKLAVAAWHDYAEGLSTIAFTVDVAHAHALAAEFRADGVPAAAVSGETPKEERRQILADFSAGILQVITNCMVLTEGTDLPLTGCILHTKPTRSATLYEQMTGRGLRPFPGKPHCVVIDVVDIARRHSLQAAPVLYGLPPGVLTKGEDLAKLEAELEALTAKYPQLDLDAALKEGKLTLAQLRAKATTFDIWAIPDLGVYKDVVSMNWIRMSDDNFRLQYPWQDGIEILQVQPNILGQFDIVVTMRPAPDGSGYAAPSKQRTMAIGISSAVDALKTAEAFILQERRAVTKLKDREAPWRMGAPSPKQLAMLKRLKVPHGPKITKGEASDLIDLAQGRRGR